MPRQSRTVRFERVVKNDEPPPATIVKDSFIPRRWGLVEGFEHYLQTGRPFNKPKSFLVRLLTVLSTIAAFFAPALFFFDQLPPAPVRWAVMAIPAILGLFAGNWIFDIVRAHIGNDSPLKGPAAQPKLYDKQHAGFWVDQVLTIYQTQARESILAPLKALKTDAENPYRIFKRIAPIPYFKLWRPHMFSRADYDAAKQRQEEEDLFTADVFSGGLLRALDTIPEPRFPNEDAVANDFYWRYDAQQVPDARIADIFLRFHQSTIERSPDETCRFKVYVAISNFRQSPVLLLCVKDVLKCLETPHRHHPSIFYGLSEITSDNVIEALRDSKFSRFPPRLERVAAGGMAPTTGRILHLNPDDGLLDMMFDPARVWAADEADLKSIEAIVALRRTIHYVSRDQTIKVLLARRDALVVNNRRVLVGRWEDRPRFYWRDWYAALRPNHRGRWLRQTYGFPNTSGSTRRNVMQEKAPVISAGFKMPDENNGPGI